MDIDNSEPLPPSSAAAAAGAGDDDDDDANSGVNVSQPASLTRSVST